MIRLPIFVSEPLDIHVFTSREYAERYLEAIDVRDGRYTAYDSSGRLLKLSVQVVNRREVVLIEAAETESTHQAQLRDHLIAFLSAIRFEQPQLAQLSLEALVEISLKYKTD